jgi:hypothetical protein
MNETNAFVSIMQQVQLSHPTEYSAAKTIIYTTMKSLSLAMHIYSLTTNEM